MLRVCLVIFGGALLLAQQSAPKFDFCGLGSHRECNCVRHTQQVRAQFISKCDLTAKTDKERDECLKNMPAHCALAEQYIKDDDGNAMPEQCTLACKRSDCKCDDGPTCHMAHVAADHFPPKGKQKDR